MQSEALSPFQDSGVDHETLQERNRYQTPMKTSKAWILLLMFACVALVGCTTSLGSRKKQVIHSYDLCRKTTVIGELGLPLGTLVEVEAEVFSGTDLPSKSCWGDSLLRIRKLNGRSLPQAIVTRWKWMVTRNATELSGNITAVGYESGEFRGIPNGVFQYVKPFTCQGFCYSTCFVVVKYDARHRE